MATFPAAGYISNAARTEGEGKTAWEDWLAATKQIAGSGVAETTISIAAGVITPTGGMHAVDTEAGAATDDLTTIAQTNLPDGSMLFLRPTSAARWVVAKHAGGGTGQLSLVGNRDVTLKADTQRLALQRRGTIWYEVARSGVSEAATVQQYARLDFVNATNVRLSSGVVPIYAGSVWHHREIPTAGTFLGNGGLGATTAYYIYAVGGAGSTVTLEASTTPPAMDNGVVIKAGDITRTLVGAVVTNASSQFAYSTSSKLVVSWFSRKLRGVSNVAATTSSASTVHLPRGNGIAFLQWEDQDALVYCHGTARNTASGQKVQTELYDGATRLAFAYSVMASASNWAPVSMMREIQGAGGETFIYRSVQAHGFVSANSGEWEELREGASFMGELMAEPGNGPNGGVAVTTPLGSLRASGPSVLLVLGFSVVAAAVLYSNYQIRTELRQQTQDYRTIVSAQTADIHSQIQAQTALITVITDGMKSTSSLERREIREACGRLVLPRQ